MADFLIECDAMGRVVLARGQIRQRNGCVYGLSGVGPGALDGLVAAHERDGHHLSRRWIGQYSAAIAERDHVILVQSSLGLGRAYWHRGPSRIVVGSNLLEVAQRTGSTALDPAYFARALALRPVMDKTPFAQVRQLHGGTTAIFSGGDMATVRPWRPESRVMPGDPTECLEEHLADAIDHLFPADSLMVCEISGGTDSSLVSAIACGAGRQVIGVSHVSARGMNGRDREFARLVAERLDVPLREFDADRSGLCTSLPDFPDQPGNGRYRHTVLAVVDLVRETRASRVATGVGGDVVFDYKGLVPAFLADGLVALRFRHAWRRAAMYAVERKRHRGAAHYLRYVGVPVAQAYFSRRNLAEPLDTIFPDWLARDLVAEARRRVPPLALSVGRPSSRYLWEAIFDQAAGENFVHPMPSGTEVVHPLLHRPLVEFMLGLSPEERRGVSGDRSLQRTILARVGLPEIAARTDKGSSQPLRELHLAEAGSFLDSMKDGELRSRGWVEEGPWRRAIEQTSVGACPHAAFFGAAVEAELWLRSFETSWSNA
ncbi:asparagine synthetase B family protein [Sagittula salina]|uniref:Asparagine synthetase domain-containing protein n=1 Tax=Sagittula salina TaxID=2820268 RepID=A0A940MLE7_9RHOB|nr:asparagine synthetase B family protein [Sagittula salina]MBP0483656.1 hypothetical protein [Sagittula salina]